MKKIIFSAVIRFYLLLLVGIWCLPNVLYASVSDYERLSVSLSELAGLPGARLQPGPHEKPPHEEVDEPPAQETQDPALSADIFSGWDQGELEIIRKFLLGKFKAENLGDVESWVKSLPFYIAAAHGGKYPELDWTGVKKIDPLKPESVENQLNGLAARYVMLIEIVREVERLYPDKERDTPVIFSFASGKMLFEGVLLAFLLNIRKYAKVALYLVDPQYRAPHSIPLIKQFLQTHPFVKRVRVSGNPISTSGMSGGVTKDLDLQIYTDASEIFLQENLVPQPGIFILIRPWLPTTDDEFNASQARPTLRRTANISEVTEKIYYAAPQNAVRWYVGNGEKRDYGFAAIYTPMTSQPFLRTNVKQNDVQMIMNYLKGVQGSDTPFANIFKSVETVKPGLIVQFLELARKYGRPDGSLFAWGPWPSIGRVTKVTGLDRPLHEIAADFYPHDAVVSI